MPFLRIFGVLTGRTSCRERSSTRRGHIVIGWGRSSNGRGHSSNHSTGNLEKCPPDNLQECPPDNPGECPRPPTSPAASLSPETRARYNFHL